MALNEQEILRGVNQKDLKAWETLYASYYAALCSYADGIVKDSDTAQDIVQDTLIRIWNSDRTFPDIKELTWYLYRSTYNNALFHLRTQASRQNILRKMVAEEVEFCLLYTSNRTGRIDPPTLCLYRRSARRKKKNTFDEYSGTFGK